MEGVGGGGRFTSDRGKIHLQQGADSLGVESPSKAKGRKIPVAPPNPYIQVWVQPK